MALSKTREKLVRSLHFAKYRDLHGKFIAEGPKLFSDLRSGRFVIDEVFATSAFIRMHHKELEGFADLHEVNEKELQKISALKTPNEVVCVVNKPKEQPLDPKTLSNLTLMLDDISDPGNLGTIIRIADWFGIRQVVCSLNSAEVYNPKVVQASMGSIARVRIEYAALGDFLRELPEDLRVFGALLGGENIYGTNLSGKGVILIGNESRGISADLLPFITSRISIPNYSPEADRAESLNAAIAAGIICAEFRRRSDAGHIEQ